MKKDKRIDKRIWLSKKHGLAPVIPVCWLCGQEKNMMALLGHKADKLEQELGHLPRNLVLDKEPCENCEAYMEKGIVFVGVKREDVKDIYAPENRSGKFFVLKDNAVKELIPDKDALENILKARACFVPDAVIDIWFPEGFPEND